MKKLVCLFMIFVLCLSFFPIIHAAEINSFEEDCVSLLRAIGIISSEKNIDVDKNITRAEFASLVVQLATQGNGVMDAPAMFKDVPSSNENFMSINCLANMGIISGYDDGSFKPNNYVTLTQAVKMLISSLAWDDFMVDKSAYPMSYLNAASKFKFFNNIQLDQNAELTWGKAALLYCNVLNTNVIYQSAYGTVDQYAQDKDLSYLNKYFDVYKTEGVVTDNGITTLTGKSRISSNQIAIDNVKYENTVFGARDMIGNYILAYFIQSDENNIGHIIHINPEYENTLTIKASNILGYDNGTYTYLKSELDNKKRVANLQTGFNVLYNGKAPVNLSLFDENKMMPEAGYIQLIDQDNKNGYETVKIMSHRTVVVSRVNYTDQIIYDKYNQNPVNLYDIEYYEISDMEGNCYQLEDLKEWDVLSVVESDDSEYVDIILNRTSFEAQVLELGENYYGLTNGKYEASSTFKQRYALALKPGDYSKFYVDHEGFLVAIDPNYNPKGGLAYLMGISKNSNGLSESYLMKLFTANGKKIVYPLAEKVTFDGSKLSVDNVISSGKLLLDPSGTINSSNTIKQLISYGINGDDEIDYLDTAYTTEPEANENPDSLNLHNGYNSASRYYINKTFGGRVMIDESTKVFLIPSDGDEDAYGVTDYTYFYGTDYVFDAYRLQSDKPIADAIVLTANITGTPYNNPFNGITLVKEIWKVVDDDGNVVQKLVGVDKSGEVTVCTQSEDTFDVEPGDIIRFGLNSKGVINDNNYQLLFDASRRDDISYTPITSGSYVGTHFMQSGRVYSIKDNVVQIAVATEDELATIEEKDLYNYIASGFSIFVVSQESGSYQFEHGSVSDLVDYQTAGTECSQIYLYTKNAVPNMMVIYK